MGDALRRRHLAVLAQRQGHLQAEQLVEHQAATGRIHLGQVGRKMDVADGGVATYQPEPVDQLGGNGIGDRPGGSQRGVDRPPQIAGPYPADRGVHRHHPSGDQRLRGAIEDVGVGTLHLQTAPVSLHLPRQSHFDALRQLALAEGLVEPHRHHQSLAVVDGGLDDGQVLAGPAHRHLLHRPDHGDLFAEREFGERDRLRPVDVAARDMKQQVGDRGDPGLAQVGTAFAAQSGDPLDADRRQVGQRPARHSTPNR